MFKQEILNKNENERNKKRHIVVSEENFLILKKLGYKLEVDSMDATISNILKKILNYQQGAFKINVEPESK